MLLSFRTHNRAITGQRNRMNLHSPFSPRLPDSNNPAPSSKVNFRETVTLAPALAERLARKPKTIVRVPQAERGTDRV